MLYPWQEWARRVAEVSAERVVGAVIGIIMPKEEALVVITKLKNEVSAYVTECVLAQ